MRAYLRWRPGGGPTGGVTLLGVDPEPGEEIFFHGHPSWRSMVPFYIRGSLASLIAGVIGGLSSAALDGHVELGWVIAGVLIVFALALSTGRLRRQRTTYSITSRRLTIETGLFSRELHQTRLERIQNVNTRQSVVQRLLKVGSVDFDTAADVEMDFTFAGVGDPRYIVRLVDHALHELPPRPVQHLAGV
jgi:uncharacterized membrane protein YdbT with pleckstrin-like domain